VSNYLYDPKDFQDDDLEEAKRILGIGIGDLNPRMAGSKTSAQLHRKKGSYVLQKSLTMILGCDSIGCEKTGPVWGI
jgi:hypothetical protein